MSGSDNQQLDVEQRFRPVTVTDSSPAAVTISASCNAESSHTFGLKHFLPRSMPGFHSRSSRLRARRSLLLGELSVNAVALALRT